MKAEITYFQNLTSGGPRGDLEKFYFGLKIFRKKLIFFSNGTPKLKYRSYKSPLGPPDVRFRKCVISAFTEKKHHPHSLFRSFFTKILNFMISSRAAFLSKFKFWHGKMTFWHGKIRFFTFGPKIRRRMRQNSFLSSEIEKTHPN